MSRIINIEPYRGVHHRITFDSIHPEDIRFMNFTGTGSQYNREGNRNFKLVVTEEDAHKLRDIGLYVAYKESSRPNYPPTYQLKVSVSYKFDEPYIILKSGDYTIRVHESTVSELDNVEWIDVGHITITTANNNFNDSKIAILDELEVTKRRNDFRDKYDKLLEEQAAEEADIY